MRVSVTRFRVRGRRLADHDIENSPHLVGEIALLHWSFWCLGAVDLPELWWPNVVTMDQGVMACLFEPGSLPCQGSGRPAGWLLS